MNILFPYLVRHLFCVVYGNRYLPRGSKEDVLSIIIVGNISFQIGNASVIRTAFRFCHDSLNLVNSVKIISSE